MKNIVVIESVRHIIEFTTSFLKKTNNVFIINLKFV